MMVLTFLHDVVRLSLVARDSGARGPYNVPNSGINVSTGCDLSLVAPDSGACR